MEDLFTSMTVGGVLIRFTFNLVFLFVLIRLLYFRYCKKEKFLFSFFLVGIIVFFICTMLKDKKIEIGVGLGLFAIFGILRFRTRNFSIKDMAYIFASIGVSVINAVNMGGFPFSGFVIINVITVLSVFVLEEYLKRNNFASYSIVYENLDLLKDGSRNKLLKDLSNKTGKEILKVEVLSLDFKRKTALLDIYFKDKVC